MEEVQQSAIGIEPPPATEIGEARAAVVASDDDLLADASTFAQLTHEKIERIRAYRNNQGAAPEPRYNCAHHGIQDGPHCLKCGVVPVPATAAPSQPAREAWMEAAMEEIALLYIRSVVTKEQVDGVAVIARHYAQQSAAKLDAKHVVTNTQTQEESQP